MPLLAALWCSLMLTACQHDSGKVRVCTEQGCTLQNQNEVTASVDSGDSSAGNQETSLRHIAQGSPKAAYDLGVRYLRGDGVRQDSYQALRWLKQSAEQGDVQAQKALGRLYLLGLEEMSPDPLAAEKWLSLAADRGDEDARQMLPAAVQASAAQRASAQDYYQWKLRWKALDEASLYSSPRYYGHWQDNAWYGY